MPQEQEQLVNCYYGRSGFQSGLLKIKYFKSRFTSLIIKAILKGCLKQKFSIIYI
jgi:hypothetical protein